MRGSAQESEKYIRDFETNNGQRSLDLLCHVALPPLFNAEFLHLVRINFFPQYQFMDEAKVLLSSLCQEYIDGLYKIYPEVRDILLVRLTKKNGIDRARQIAALLWQYNEKFSPWKDNVRLERLQQLTVINVIDDSQARMWINKFEKSVTGDTEEWFVAVREKIEQTNNMVFGNQLIGVPNSQIFNYVACHGDIKASICGTIGNLYSDTEKYEQAENAYREALQIRKRLAEINPDTYLPDVARTQNNFGTLYSDTEKYEQAENAYREALQTYKRLAEINPDAYLPNVAATQNNFGNLYRVLGKYQEAENAYREALQTYKRLAEINPDAYLPNVATTQNNFGNLYSDIGKYQEAENAYQEALQTYKRLAEINPDVYLRNYNIVLENIEIFLNNTKNE